MIFGLGQKINYYDWPDEERVLSIVSIDRPSWNWIAPGVRVHFRYAEFRGISVACIEVARVDEIEIEYSSSVYGSVKSGKFVISSPCYYTRLVLGVLMETDHVHQQWPLFNAHLNAELKTDLEFGVRLRGKYGGEYALIQLFSLYGSKRELVRVYLVLECLESSTSDNNNTSKYYRRVGLLDLKNPTKVLPFDANEIMRELDGKRWPEDKITIIWFPLGYLEKGKVRQQRSLHTSGFPSPSSSLKSHPTLVSIKLFLF